MGTLLYFHQVVIDHLDQFLEVLIRGMFRLELGLAFGQDALQHVDHLLEQLTRGTLVAQPQGQENGQLLQHRVEGRFLSDQPLLSYFQ